MPTPPITFSSGTQSGRTTEPQAHSDATTGVRTQSLMTGDMADTSTPSVKQRVTVRITRYNVSDTLREPSTGQGTLAAAQTRPPTLSRLLGTGVKTMLRIDLLPANTEQNPNNNQPFRSISLGMPTHKPTAFFSSIDGAEGLGKLDEDWAVVSNEDGSRTLTRDMNSYDMRCLLEAVIQRSSSFNDIETAPTPAGRVQPHTGLYQLKMTADRAIKDGLTQQKRIGVLKKFRESLHVKTTVKKMSWMSADYLDALVKLCNDTTRQLKEIDHQAGRALLDNLTRESTDGENNEGDPSNLNLDQLRAQFGSTVTLSNYAINTAPEEIENLLNSTLAIVTDARNALQNLSSEKAKSALSTLTIGSALIYTSMLASVTMSAVQAYKADDPLSGAVHSAASMGLLLAGVCFVRSGHLLLSEAQRADLFGLAERVQAYASQSDASIRSIMSVTHFDQETKAEALNTVTTFLKELQAMSEAYNDEAGVMLDARNPIDRLWALLQ